MARYMAQNQSLYGVPGAPNQPRPPIDVAGAIDAVTSGATSLIHGAMLRRQAQNEQAYRQAEVEARKAQIGIEQQREAREASNQQQEFGLRQEAERHRFIEAGGIPAHTETQAVGAQQTIAPISPIARAMTSGADQSGIPGVQVTPSNAPGSVQPAASPTSTTVYHPENVEAPESFDPQRGAAYQRGVAVQSLRNEGYATRDEHRQEFQAEQQAARLKAMQAAREYSAAAAQNLAKLRAQLAEQKGGVRGAMTGNVRETAMQKTAEGLLEQFNGSLDDATDFLNNTTQGKSLRDEGLEPRHLMAARGKYVSSVSGQAVRLQSGALGMAPEEAVTAVGKTRRLVGGGGGKTAAPTGGETSTVTPQGKVTTTPNATSTPKPTAQPAAKPAAKPADDYTPDELADAFAAGKTTDKDIEAFIKTARAKKPKGKS